MSDLRERLSALSPEKQRLLELLYQERLAGRDRGPAGLQLFGLISLEDRARIPPGVVDAYPLTLLQSGMLFHMEEVPDYPLYQNVDSMRIQGLLVSEALRDTVDRVVARHPVLRTSFDLGSFSQPLQLVWERASMPVMVHDLRPLPPAEQEEAVRATIESERRRRFNMSRPPLLRFNLHILSDESFQFTLTEFHPILDGWSLQSMFVEILRSYHAQLRGDPLPEEPPLEQTFREYVTLERQALSSEEQKDFWLRTLADASVIELPRWPQRFRTPAERPVLAFTARLSRTLLAACKELASRERVPLKSIFLTAHFKVLSLLAGSRDVITGITTEGRPEGPQGDRILGLFLNTLPLRARLPEGSWLDLLHRIFASEQEILPYRRYPYAAIQKSWGRPLFEVVFNMTRFHVYQSLNAQEGELRRAGFSTELEESHFTLTSTFTMDPAGNHLALLLEYRPTDLSLLQIRQIADAYTRILEVMIADPGGRHGEVGLLDEAQQQQVLVEWSDSRRDHAGGCLHDLFAEQARRTPHRVAVSCDTENLTFGELDRRADHLARLLVRLGVGAEVLVGLCFERSLEMVTALLAVLKAGGAYVPLDPDYPLDRLARILADCRPLVVLTREDLAARLPEGIQTEFVDCGAPLPRGGGSLPPTRVTGRNLAYVIYTSGSTGEPKGVMMSHAGIRNRLQWMLDAHLLDAADRVLQKTSISFDASIWEIFCPLLAGARLVLAAPGEHQDPAKLLQRVVRDRVTTLQLVPSMLRLFAEEDGLEDAVTLRRLFAGGEALPTDLAGRVLGRLGIPVHNLYGPTEAAIDTASWIWRGGAEPALVPVVPLGRPLHNVQVYILDESLQPVLPGVIGELYIAGAGLARGYLGRPDLSAAVFLPDPFGGEPGGRLYRSGDLARHLPDGVLEFVGRRDEQVKVHGFRIEPGEVAAVLRQHPDLREAVVLARRNGHEDPRLVAYVVPAAPQSPSTLELRRFLEGRLPAYMMPAAFISLRELPLTPTGKLDRSALPDVNGSRPDVSVDYVPPRNRNEAVLAEIWARVLRVNQVGMHDDFFALGGDSILSHQIATRARRAGLQMAPQQVFAHPTIAELTRALGGLEVPHDHGPVSGDSPLTPIQRWFFEEQGLELHHFNQALILAARERLEPARLAAVLDHLAAHHDALRMRFLREEDWRQVCLEHDPRPKLVCVDLRALPGSAQPQAVEAVSAEVQTGFDLSAGPLFRAALFDLGPDRLGRLLLAAHHLVVDGISWRILLEDLETAYRQFEEGGAVALPPKTASYPQWAGHLIEYARSETLHSELDHWLAEERKTVPRLPADLYGGADTATSARTVWLSLEPEETRALLQEVPRAYRTEINDVLLAAVGQTLAQWLGSRRVLIDLEGHGRENLFPGVDVSRTVGWFTSIFPVLLEVGKTSDPGRLLRSVKEQLRCIPQRGVGYGVLRYLGAGEMAAALRALPRAEVIFNYLGQLDQALEEGSVFQAAPEAVGPSRSPRARRSHALEVEVRVARGRLQVGWTFSRNRFRRETIAQLGVGFLVALRALIEHCRTAAGIRTSSDFPLADLDQPSLDRVLRQYPEAEDLYPLSPLQEGLLFHALNDPGAGLYLVQYHFPLRGALDAAALRRAWERIVSRHPVLRTAFVWEGLAKPLQVVLRQVELPWREEDWRVHEPERRLEKLEALLVVDRTQDFDLRAAPLLRLQVLRTGEDRFEVIWTLHHLLLDGWSAPLLNQELMALYQAFSRGEDLALAPVRPFRDYIAWLRAQDRGAAERYWRQCLAGFSEPTRIPFDNADGPRHGPGAAHALATTLPVAAAESLRAFARRHRLTLNTLLQGAWGFLLSRYAGSDDVVFGSVVSGRPTDLPDVETMVGLFINTLPVRVRVRSCDSLAPWLEGLQEEQLAQRRYEYSPLVQVRAWSEIPGSRPLFESLIVFENYPEPELVRSLESRGQRLEILDPQVEERTHYPLTLKVEPGGRRLSLELLYDTARFDEISMRRLLVYLTTLLQELARGEARRVGELPRLAPAERHALLVESNRGAWGGLSGVTVHQLFEVQAAVRPDAIALIQGGESLTYGMLDRRANRWARHLRSLGVGPGVLAGVFVERSLDMVAALLAVLKAGGAYLPLDLRLPADRLAAILGDARPRLVITREWLAERLPVEEPKFRIVDLAALRGEPPWVAVREDVPPAGASPDDLAYVVYTSGSTGLPKGSEIPHRSFMGFMFGVDYARFDERQVWLQYSSVSWDALTLELWPALLHGGRCILFPEGKLDPEDLGRAVREHGVNIAWLTSSFFNLMIDTCPEDLAGLEQLLIGGESLSVSHVRRALERLPRTRIVNGYGPSECTVFSCCQPIPRDLPPDLRSIPIGRPIGDRRVYLLDRQGDPVPWGVPGEICIAGSSVARGYLHRPELTAEKMVPDEVTGEPGARLYRTGDLGRYLPDGRLEFLGRFDQQVKIRGFRIELEEIEAVLAQHPAVEAAAVVVQEKPAIGKRLAGFLVPRSVVALRTEEVREWLAQRLPDYMIPAAFLRLASLPLLATGKLDRRFLATLQPNELAVVNRAEEPRTVIEDMMAQIWADILGIHEIGLDDDFFALGGHSLLATQIVSRARRTFAVEFPLRQIFEAPTVRELAWAVERERRAGRAVQAPPLEAVWSQGDAPLSFAQERLWFLDQMSPGTAAYNIASAFLLEGRLDVAALTTGLTEVVRRQAALRTTFATVAGRPVQRISPAAPVPVPLVDLSALPEASRRPLAERLAAEEAQRPFDLQRGPLLRVRLLRLKPLEHVTLIEMHHIVSDGWSMVLFARELSAAYEALAARREPELPPLPVQYADYAVWQRSWLQGEVLEAEVDHWLRRLAGSAMVLDLPTDRPRPAAQSFRGASEELRIDRRTTNALVALGRGQEATLFMSLLAAFQSLISRYTRQEAFNLGMPIAGRQRIEVEGVIGFFVNTLVLRSDLSGGPGLATLISRARATALDAYDHQDVPLERLVEELAPERNLSYSPLFQVLFVLQNLPTASFRTSDLKIGSLGLEHTAAKFDLTIEFFTTPEGLDASLQYPTDLFDATTIRRLLGHFGTLLEAGLEDPERPVWDLPLLTAPESEELRLWNQTGAPLPESLLAHGLFEAQVDRTPDAPAIETVNLSLSYRELDAAANRLAHHLRGLGVGPEVLVGLCLERSPEALVGFWAILKAGGTYLPLDPGYPQERLAYMLEDSGAYVLLTRSELLPRLPPFGGTVSCLDLDEMRIARQSAERPRTALLPENRAYVIYTSGSTGRPKGAEIQHLGLCSITAVGKRLFAATPGSRFLQFSSLNFDASLFEIVIALQSGASLYIAPPGSLLLGNELLNTLYNRGISHIVLTPSALTSLPSADLPDLRTVMVAGEACPPDLVRRWAPGRAYFNLYGPTEASIWATAMRCTDGERRPPIGRPIENVRICVLDPYFGQQPIGVPGELYIGGAGVARGYLGRPDLTASRFLPDSFAAEPGSRLYRTGDLAVLRPDGQLDFLGRIDHQIKVRGFRVEFGEIETALQEHPAVMEAIIVAREDVAGTYQMSAYAACGEAVLSPGELRTFLRQSLPEYMMPSHIVVLASLPLTPNGKVDRKALPDPAVLPGRSEGFESSHPRTPIEELLAGYWSQALGIDLIGCNDNFFERGGHSLLATYLVARLRDTFGVELEVRDLFEEPTIGGMALRIQNLLARYDLPAASGIERVPRRGALPLSHAQQRLWFLDCLVPGSSVYNISLAFRIAGELSIPALRRALKGLVERHETLRTRFELLDGEPVQWIEEPAPVPFGVVDLEALTPAVREQEVHRLVREEVRRPFDLSFCPLVRTALLRLAPEEQVFLFSLHHIVGDGASMRILVREISALYAAALSGRPAGLPPLPIQYADFAVWQREWLAGGALDGLLAYWRERLAGMPGSLDLPTDRPRPAVQLAPAGACMVVLPQPLAEGLRRLAAQEGVTLFMVFLAALQALLLRISGQDDFAVGTPVAGRNRAETEYLIGFFVNTLALRARPAARQRFRDLLGKVRETALGAYTHDALPFEKLVEELGVERNLGQTPLFQVLLTVDEEVPVSPELPGVELQLLESPLTEVKFDLQVAVSGTFSGELSASLTYNADLFDGATAGRLLGRWVRLLEGTVGHPGTEVGELPLISASEADQVLMEWNRTGTDFGEDRTLLELLEAPARANPAAVAVSFEGRTWSYDEIHRSANRLAHLLQRLGVAAETPVGVCLERSFEMVYALLGVLKAGGAFLPLDPDYPTKRLEAMVESAQPPVLLTVERLRPLLPATDAAVVCLDCDVVALAGELAESPAPAASEDALAYILYTSGSTGQPKGCMNSLSALRNRLLWMQQAYRLGPEDRVLQKTPFSFDVSVWELFWPLLAGARLVIARPGGHRDSVYLADLIRNEEVSLLHFVPSMLSAFLEEPAAVRCLSLKRVVCSGEALPAETVRRFGERLPASLHNLYGPTETAIEVTHHDCEGGDPAPVTPIGRPIANARIYVLDEELRLVPPDTPGELYIGGVAVGRGYVRQPHLTAERFLPDPSSGVPGARMYRSGDRARFRQDGVIDFLGRVDHQVKLRGFRIEIGEIEAALREQPGVREAVVLAQGTRGNAERLVAYVVPIAPGEPLGDLLGHLHERLPLYMVPGQLVVLPELPRLASGKVDRRSLPEPEHAAAPAGAARKPPRNPLELQLVQIWEGLLGRSGIGVEDDFFALGGHSLLAVRLMARVRQRFGRQLPLATLFHSPTVERLAAVLSRESEPAAGGPLVAIQPRGQQPPFFCVHPIGGDILCYLDLARELGPEQPFYALQAPALLAAGEPFSDIESVAETYLREVDHVQPQDPRQLGGWSFGGVVAFAMALRLQERSGELATLVLLDTPAPARLAKLLELQDRLGIDDAVRLALDGRERMQQADAALEIDGSELLALSEEERLLRVLERLRRERLIPAEIGIAEARGYLAKLRQRQQAVRGFAPGTFRGRVVLLRAQDRQTDVFEKQRGIFPEEAVEELRAAEKALLDDPTYGWQEVCSRPVEVYIVPGDHHTLVREPYVRHLAGQLRRCLPGDPS